MMFVRLVTAFLLATLCGAFVNEAQNNGTFFLTALASSRRMALDQPAAARTAQLKFEIDQVYWSEPLQGDESAILHRFATSRELRNRLITPHGSVVEYDLHPNDLSAMHAYRQAFIPHASVLPSLGNGVGLKFTTGAVQFPGLTIESTVQCGVGQSVDPTQQADGWVVPPYEFNVLQTTNKARGIRPLLWFFGKLDAPVSRSLTQAGLARKHPNGPLYLKYHSRARVEFGFSPRLTKALPLSQHRTEALGSQALEKAVRSEVNACIQKCIPLLQGK